MREINNTVQIAKFGTRRSKGPARSCFFFLSYRRIISIHLEGSTGFWQLFCLAPAGLHGTQLGQGHTFNLGRRVRYYVIYCAPQITREPRLRFRFICPFVGPFLLCVCHPWPCYTKPGGTRNNEQTVLHFLIFVIIGENTVMPFALAVVAFSGHRESPSRAKRDPGTSHHDHEAI
jgi:hypothetical protein